MPLRFPAPVSTDAGGLLCQASAFSGLGAERYVWRRCLVGLSAVGVTASMLVAGAVAAGGVMVAVTPRG